MNNITILHKKYKINKTDLWILKGFTLFIDVFLILSKVTIKNQWSIKTTFNKAVEASAESVILETQHRMNTTIHTGSSFHSVGRLCFDTDDPLLQKNMGKMHTSDPHLDVPLGVGRDCRQLPLTKLSSTVLMLQQISLRLV